MHYAALIYVSDAAYAAMTPAQGTANMQAYGEFTAAVSASGHMHSGEALQGTNTATTVRVRDGKTVTTDGPFAETKEQLTGFYVLTCKDLDEAIMIAAKIPDAKIGSIEVRPIMEMAMPAN